MMLCIQLMEAIKYLHNNMKVLHNDLYWYVIVLLINLHLHTVSGVYRS